MQFRGEAVRSIVAFKAALLSLISANTAYYLFFGTRSEALDSPAWLVLLIAFQAESGIRERFGENRMAMALRGVRILAVAALLAAAFGYAQERDWLDVLNVGLWMAVVALLEFQLRYPDRVRRFALTYAAAAAALYAGLVALIAVWLMRREWFDAYDATLWLAAFAVVELDLIGRPENAAP